MSRFDDRSFWDELRGAFQFACIVWAMFGVWALVTWLWPW